MHLLAQQTSLLGQAVAGDMLAVLGLDAGELEGGMLLIEDAEHAHHPGIAEDRLGKVRQFEGEGIFTPLVQGLVDGETETAGAEVDPAGGDVDLGAGGAGRPEMQQNLGFDPEVLALLHGGGGFDKVQA